MRGNGSSARSVLSSGPVGGSTALSWRRIAERCTSRRRSGAGLERHRSQHPRHEQAHAGGEQRARARRRRPQTPGDREPPTQSRAHALEAAGQQRARDQRAEQRRTPAPTATRRPPESTSGASRVPIHAPTANPTRASAPARNPCAQPKSASSSDDAEDDPVDPCHLAPSLRREPACSPAASWPDALDPHVPRTRPARAASHRRCAVARGLARFAGGVVAAGPARAGTSAGAAAGASRAAWERGDYAAMHASSTPGAAARDPAATLRAHATGGRPTRPRVDRACAPGGRGEPRDGSVDVPRRASARACSATSAERRAAGRRGRRRRAARSAGRRTLAFPGLRAGERLRAHDAMPPRATIQARDGTPIAAGRGARCPSSTRSPRRSRAASARCRPSGRRATPRSASRPTRRSA